MEKRIIDVPSFLTSYDSTVSPLASSCVSCEILCDLYQCYEGGCEQCGAIESDCGQDCGEDDCSSCQSSCERSGGQCSCQSSCETPTQACNQSCNETCSDGTCQSTMSCIVCELTECIPCLIDIQSSICVGSQACDGSCLVGCLGYNEDCATAEGCSDIVAEYENCFQAGGGGGRLSNISSLDGGSCILTVTLPLKPFNSTNYGDFIVTSKYCGETVAMESHFSEIVGRKSPPTTGTSKTITIYLNNLSIYVQSANPDETLYAYIYDKSVRKFVLLTSLAIYIPLGIEKWEWSDEAYNAFNNQGFTTNLRWGEWNTFVERVKEVTRAVGISNQLVSEYQATNHKLMAITSQTTIYNLLSRAKATASGQVILAKQLNTVNYAIKEMNNDIGNPTLNSGDKAYGHYFISLGNYLNACI